MANKIKELISQSGKSKSQIARELGVARQTVQSWVVRGSISKSKLVEFCVLTGVSVHTVLDEQDLYSDALEVKIRLKGIIDNIPENRIDVLEAIELLLTK